MATVFQVIQDNRPRIQSVFACSLVVLGIVPLLPYIVGTVYVNAGAIRVSKAWAGAESFSCSCSATQSGSVEPRALDYLLSGISWTGGNPRSNYLLAMTYAKLGDYNTALGMLRSLLEAGSDARVQLCMGDIYDAMGFSAQAREAWFMSGAAGVFLRRAKLAIANRNPNQASVNLALTFRLMDKYGYYHRLAVTYLALGKLQRDVGMEQESLVSLAQATAVYDQALVTDTVENQEKIMFRIWRAQSFRERQMYAQAVDELKQIVMVEPTGRAYAELAVTYGYLRSWAEAVRTFRIGLAGELGSEPSAFPYWIQLAIAYRENKEFALALEVLERVVQETSNPDWQAWAYTDMGITLAIQGNVLESLSPLHKAVVLNPDWVHPRFALASSLAALKRTSEACEQYRVIISLDPGNEWARLQLEHIQCPALP